MASEVLSSFDMETLQSAKLVFFDTFTCSLAFVYREISCRPPGFGALIIIAAHVRLVFVMVSTGLDGQVLEKRGGFGHFSAEHRSLRNNVGCCSLGGSYEWHTDSPRSHSTCLLHRWRKALVPDWLRILQGAHLVHATILIMTNASPLHTRSESPDGWCCSQIHLQ